MKKRKQIAKAKDKKISHLKFSLRLNNRVTSLTIKQDIAILWFLYTSDFLDSINVNNTLDEILQTDIKENTILPYINEFIHTSLNDWKKDTGKGLSDFITKRMIKDFINDKKLYKLFSLLMEKINES